MYKNLLVATDGSKLSDEGALRMRSASRKPSGAKVTGFYAAPDYPMPAYADGVVYEPVSRKEYAKLAGEDAQKILGRRRDQGRGGGVPARPSTRSPPLPGKRSSPRQERTNAMAIVMASHGRRFGIAPRQRNAKGADAHQAAGDHRSLATHGSSRVAVDPRCSCLIARRQENRRAALRVSAAWRQGQFPQHCKRGQALAGSSPLG